MERGEIFQTLRNVLFGPSQAAAAASEARSWPRPAVMETLNIDAAIIQGHVDTALCLSNWSVF